MTHQEPHPFSTRRCSSVGCGESAIWRPVLVLARMTNSGRLAVSLPLAVCAGHRAATVLDMLSIAGVDVIEDVLAPLGLDISDVDWERSAVRFVVIS